MRREREVDERTESVFFERCSMHRRLKDNSVLTWVLF